MTGDVLDKAGIAPERLPPAGREGLTVAAHLAYGAAAGALLGLLRPRGALQGAGWGVLLWTVSYLGWVPATGIGRAAFEEPARRNALMIAAHIVWGGVAAALLGRALSPGTPRRNNP